MRLSELIGGVQRREVEGDIPPDKTGTDDQSPYIHEVRDVYESEDNPVVVLDADGHIFYTPKQQIGFQIT